MQRANQAIKAKAQEEDDATKDETEKPPAKKGKKKKTKAGAQVQKKCMKKQKKKKNEKLAALADAQKKEAKPEGRVSAEPKENKGEQGKTMSFISGPLSFICGALVSQDLRPLCCIVITRLGTFAQPDLSSPKELCASPVCHLTEELLRFFPPSWQRSGHA